jgi:cardiolipin synthase A/B
MKWCFYRSSAHAWDTLYEACAKAKSSIDFEQYIFADDAAGSRFIDLFERKSKEGVRVRLLCDMQGSFSFFISSRVRELEEAGAKVQFFNPVSPWRVRKFFSWFNRDHRKLVIIDRELGFTGGVGVRADMTYWQDMMVSFAGDVVIELEQAFEHMWYSTKRDQFLRFKDPKQTPDGFFVATNAPHFRQRHINGITLEAMRGAKKSVYITTPYFVPDTKFFRVLRLAARRGIDVRLLIPKVTNHLLVDFASHSFYSRALRFGVRIFEYGDGEKAKAEERIHTMHHGKTIVIDGEWASVGSANIDNLSTFFNHELVVASVNKKFAADIQGVFLDDLQYAKEIRLNEWKARAFSSKVLEWICRPLGYGF